MNQALLFELQQDPACSVDGCVVAHLCANLLIGPTNQRKVAGSQVTISPRAAAHSLPVFCHLPLIEHVYDGRPRRPMGRRRQGQARRHPRQRIATVLPRAGW